MKKKQEKIELGKLYYSPGYGTTVIPIEATFPDAYMCINVDGRSIEHYCGGRLEAPCGIWVSPDRLIKLKSPAHLKKLEGK